MGYVCGGVYISVWSVSFLLLLIIWSIPGVYLTKSSTLKTILQKKFRNVHLTKIPYWTPKIHTITCSIEIFRIQKVMRWNGFSKISIKFNFFPLLNAKEIQLKWFFLELPWFITDSWHKFSGERRMEKGTKLETCLEGSPAVTSNAYFNVFTFS